MVGQKNRFLQKFRKSATNVIIPKKQKYRLISNTFAYKSTDVRIGWRQYRIRGSTREIEQETEIEQDKYTMDPGRQIYLRNINKNFGQK